MGDFGTMSVDEIQIPPCLVMIVVTVVDESETPRS